VGTTLVTGGLGYVGRHLVTLLSRSGEQVVSYNRDYSEHDEPGVVTVQGELYEIPRIVSLCREHGVERIIHTAGLSHPDLSIELPITTISANVEGTLHVFEAARMAGVKRIVNFSSECAYGHVDGAVTEAARLQPITPYGATKVFTEHLGRIYNDVHDMDVVSLRITEVYGPGNKMPELMRDMLKAAIEGRRYELETGAEHRIRFIHVEDVARAAQLASVCDGPAQTAYNVRGDVEVTVAELADRVRGMFDGADIAIGPGYLHLDRQGPWDVSAAERDLGYRAEWTLERGLADYADWLQTHAH
jgi:nucleoside-diphosphate-sugar epimerase